MGELLKAKVRRGGGARAFGPHPALRWLPQAAVRFSGVQEDSGAWLWCSGDDMVIDAIRKASPLGGVLGSGVSQGGDLKKLCCAIRVSTVLAGRGGAAAADADAARVSAAARGAPDLPGLGLGRLDDVPGNRMCSV